MGVVTAAHQHPDLHDLVDKLNSTQADAVRAVLQLVTNTPTVTTTEPAVASPRRVLSFAGTLSAEPDFAERSEEILDEIVRRNAG